MNETTNGNTSPDSANQDSTRRQFIGTSLSIAAGSATVGTATRAFPSTVHAGGDDVLRVGLIGCGGRGTGAAGQALQCLNVRFGLEEGAGLGAPAEWP